MGLKKYEIITVGSDKRVRALRSWQVGDRYVNIGDVGGIVYDEKTLSQDGLCWLFKGNFGFPGARIGGDSIVDVGEAAIDANGSANVDILGSSTVVGAPVKFTVGLGAVNGLVLTAADFEQGEFVYSKGLNWETWKRPNDNFIRLKAPVFMGGVAATLKLDVPGYAVQAFVMDRDGMGTSATAVVSTGAGVTLTVPAGQYFIVKLRKDPAAAIVPADATAAQITTTAVFDTKLVVVDSRLELSPANGTGAIAIRSGGLYSVTPGAKYPDSVIQGSKVVISSHASTARMIRMLTELVNVSATIDATTADAQAVGIYHGVNNLTFTGLITSNWNVAARSLIQAYDCDNMVVSPTVFPGLATAQTANVPFIFQGCNVPDGRFYHHAQIANTYKNIDFAKAQADLGKIVSGRPLVSSEVEGMYRYVFETGAMGPLIEAYDSVKSLNMTGDAATYGTSIYKDAYFNGIFDFAGTNVFGNKVRSRPLAQVLNVQPRAVQGGFTLTAGQPPVPSTESTRVRTEKYFRLNGANGISVQNIPAGLEARIVYLDGSGNYVALGDWYAGSVIVPKVQLINTYAYLLFRKTGDTAITPADLAGVTVTTYNGCKLVNTKETAAVIAGNVRVEDNATLVGVSVTGTGYFGGNSVIQAPSDLVGPLPIVGAAYMSDNAVFVPSAANASAGMSLLEMKDNATFSGQLAVPGSIYNIIMADNAQFLGTLGSRNSFNMRDNSFVAAAGVVASTCKGLMTLKDDARIENGVLTAIGHITLCGKYKQTTTKTWTGKRVIGSQDAPTYDDNVKTKYDI